MKIQVSKIVPFLVDKEGYRAKGGYTIPEELINEDNVFLDFYIKTHKVEVQFSVNIAKELASWPKKYMKRLIDDINTDIEVFIHEPWNNITREAIYRTIFTILGQVY